MVNAAWLLLQPKKQPLGNKASGAAKTIVKNDPETLQDSARHVPRPSKIEAPEVPGNQNPSKTCPRPAKSTPRVSEKSPRSAQEDPIATQECLKASPVAPKSCPGEARTPPKLGPAIPETSFSPNLRGKLCSTGPSTDLMLFFGLCDKTAIWKKL